MAGNYDITIEQGATFELNFVVKSAGVAVDFGTGATARMQVRANPTTSAKLLDLTSGAGDITVTPASGAVAVTVAAAVTAAMTSGGVYDIEVVFGSGGDKASGTVMRVLQGKATLSPEVTR